MAEAVGSFGALKNLGLLTQENISHFQVERNFLIALMAKRLAHVNFDEAWYLSKYPDVREAVTRGVFPSAREHYVLFGYYEHRMPAAILVNERWYLDAYPDVAKAIKAGVYKSGQMHFDIAGFREGRLPYANFQL
jgi:hypothetical protein